jgi:hypothetical protein
MKKVILLTVLLLIIEQINADGLISAYTLKPAEQAMFLDSHNAIRKAYNMPPLVWDAQLAADSATYANQCQDNPLKHSAANGAYGENLSYYMATPKPATFPYKTMDYHVVTGWYQSEEKNWNCATNACNTANGGMCGHLTQCVWYATTSVGCGIANCRIDPTSTSTKTWYVQNAVCRYKTAGNVVGTHPLQTASKCPVQPTTLGPITPTAPVPPVNPPPTPVAPVKPPTTPPVAPVAPVTPVAPKPSPVAPVTPVAPIPSPVAPVAPAPGTLWWSGCICNYWPTDPATGKQYQQLTPCKCNHGRIPPVVKLGAVLIPMMNLITVGHCIIYNLELLLVHVQMERPQVMR